MEAAADKEFVQMRKGDKLLETVIAITPLLGLLGTVTGLITTFGSLKIGGGDSNADATRAAAGMIVAIIALFFSAFLSVCSRSK